MHAEIKDYPTSNGGMQKWKLSQNVHTLHTRFFWHVLAPTCMLGRCLSTKFLHQSSGGSLLRACCWLGAMLARPGMLSLKFVVFLPFQAQGEAGGRGQSVQVRRRQGRPGAGQGPQRPRGLRGGCQGDRRALWKSVLVHNRTTWFTLVYLDLWLKKTKGWTCW